MKLIMTNNTTLPFNQDSARVIGLYGCNDFSVLKGVAMMKKYFPDVDNQPQLLKSMRSEHFNFPAQWSVFSILVHYLEKNLLAK